jgi:hypothetical protein
LLPGEVLLDEIFQRDAADEVVQAPPGGDMTDDQDPLSVPPQRQVAEEAADAGDGLPAAQLGQLAGQPAGGAFLLALNACIWHNWQIGAPVKRSLTAYDHL